MEFSDLVGKCVIGLFKRKDIYIFMLEDGTGIAVDAEGDCCSKSWIEHISGTDHLLNQLITRTETTNCPCIDNNDNNYIKAYSYKIYTNKGICELEMRNSSNGYYGGWLNFYPTSLLNEKMIGDF